jgi:hypothetical protein
MLFCFSPALEYIDTLSLHQWNWWQIADGGVREDKQLDRKFERRGWQSERNRGLKNTEW